MNLSNYLKRLQNIITDPKREFLTISKENSNPISVFIQYITPYLVTYALAAYLGKIFFSPATFNVGTGIVLKSIFLIILVKAVGVYLSAIAINEILPFFHAQRNRNKSFALVAYSLTPVYLSLILAGLIPNLSNLFYFIGFYSVILFWISSSAIIDMTKERRQIFVPVSLMMIVLIFLVIRIILGAIFSL